MTEKSFSEGDWERKTCRAERERGRIKGLNMENRDRESLSSGDRQGKVVLS